MAHYKPPYDGSLFVYCLFLVCNFFMNESTIEIILKNTILRVFMEKIIQGKID